MDQHVPKNHGLLSIHPCGWLGQACLPSLHGLFLGRLHSGSGFAFHPKHIHLRLCLVSLLACLESLRLCCPAGSSSGPRSILNRLTLFPSQSPVKNPARASLGRSQRGRTLLTKPRRPVYARSILSYSSLRVWLLVQVWIVLK